MNWIAFKVIVSSIILFDLAATAAQNAQTSNVSDDAHLNLQNVTDVFMSNTNNVTIKETNQNNEKSSKIEIEKSSKIENEKSSNLETEKSFILTTLSPLELLLSNETSDVKADMVAILSERTKEEINNYAIENQNVTDVINVKPPKVQLATETTPSSTQITTQTIQTTKLKENKTEKSTESLVTTATSETIAASTQRNSLDFGFRKCCKPQEILHLAPTGKPVCETMYGLELPPLVPQNMGHVKIPDCANGTLKIVHKFIQSPSESRSATGNNLTLAYKEEDFCNDFGIEDGSFITTVALVCERPQENICKENPDLCISLCCPHDHVCLPPQTKFFQDKYMISTQIDCEDSQKNLTLKDTGVYLLERKLRFGEYCIEPLELPDDTGRVQGSTCLQSTMNYEFMMTTRVVIATLLCISIISLFVSLVLHMVVPELHASTFGWMKISHLFSMFWAFLILFVMYLGGIDLVFKYSVLCKILGFVMHYFFVASFFWVNVMSFDIWRTFRHIRGISKNPGVKSDNHRKFIYYSVYAWGSSLVVSAITILMESLPESMTENLMTPNIGVHSCFFQSNLSKMIYFHAPVSLLLTANIIFFIMSSWSLLMGVWAPSATDRIKQQTKQRFMVVVELFFVMGLNWVAEIISWALGWSMGLQSISKISMVFDIANSLQGFIIFIIVVLKSRTIKSIKKFWHGIPVSAHNSYKKVERGLTRISTTISPRFTSSTELGGIDNQAGPTHVSNKHK